MRKLGEGILGADNSAVTSVVSSASNVTLLAENHRRLGASVHNDSTANLYLKFGATASTSSFTIKIAANTFWAFPGPTMYTGIVDGIWDAANGNARMTETS